MNGALSQRLKSSCPDLTGLLHDPSCNFGCRSLSASRPAPSAGSGVELKFGRFLTASVGASEFPLQVTRLLCSGRSNGKNSHAASQAAKAAFAASNSQQRVISLPSSSAVLPLWLRRACDSRHGAIRCRQQKGSDYGPDWPEADTHPGTSIGRGGKVCSKASVTPITTLPSKPLKTLRVPTGAKFTSGQELVPAPIESLASPRPMS
jgi:hypothetical protein